MMKIVVLVCLVGVISAAEVDFRQRSNAAAGGRPIHIPVVPRRPSVQQLKRQVDFDASNGPAPQRPRQQSRQQPSVPQQQPFRPQQAGAAQQPSSFRQGPSPAAQRPREPQQSQPSAPESVAPERAGPAQYAAPVPSEQAFADQREAVDTPVRPQRQNRPSAAASAQERQRTPEFGAGFPKGFTEGLPAFDFQGRMPEADAKSDGFMDGAFPFPSLKAFGGFDPLPELARENADHVQVKRQPASLGSGRPGGVRPAQRGSRPSAN